MCVIMIKIRKGYLDDVIFHIRSHLIFSDSAQKSGQNGIQHHHIPYMGGHMTMQGWFSDSTQKSDQNDI